MDEKPQTPPDSEAAKQPTEPPKPAEPPIQTEHQITLGRKKLNYHVTTGMMPLKTAAGETEANIFFMAYTLDKSQGDPKRPLTFVFNGGPGSASVWLHLGALGPKRVKMTDEGFMPPPPYQLVDNENTWLDQTDLVFIDPVGTGYSRATKPELNKKFWKVKGDIESVGEFIRLYLTQYNRWTSPLFLAGESYGTTRAAGLSGYLVDKGIALNGIVLISTVMNFQTVDFDRGNDLPFALFLPTYTATAWYHSKLPAGLQERPLREVLAEVSHWAETDYSVALMKGDRLADPERAKIIEKLSSYTGLSTRYLDESHLRIHIMRFCKELLREQKRTVGRLDSRFKGMDALEVNEVPDFDPSLVAITPPYTAMFNHYARTELGYETDVEYQTLSFEVNGGWEWEGGKYVDTSEALRSAFAKNPYLKLFVAMGYYDLATPFFAAEYTLTHMDIDPSLRDSIHTGDYEAGHMLYLDVKSLKKLKGDVVKFMGAAL
jgi:carboxypeptidase C (cathepsin A)